MKIKWMPIRVPYRTELIKDVTLESDGKIIARGGKDNPIKGRITHCRTKMIGRNRVTMYLFKPDIKPDSGWEFSRKAFGEFRSEANV